MRAFGILTAALALAGAGCHSQGMKAVAADTGAIMPARTAAIDRATVMLAPTAGNSVGGSLTFTTVGNDLHVQGQINGLQPGSTHGFHIHEKGNCSAPDGSSAGGHFNPRGVMHGDPGGMAHHAGDIPNQTADAHGYAIVDVLVHGISIGTGGADDVLGRSVIVHKDRDDYTSQPAGNSGARLACGVIVGRRNDQ